MKTFIWLALSFLSYTSINEDLMPEARHCMTMAVRQTWGAEARLRGSPDTAQFAPLFRIKRMFEGDEPTPNDGIYIAEELDGDARLEYWIMARMGWGAAKDWRRIFSRETVPSHDQMVARFYSWCRYGQPRE